MVMLTKNEESRGESVLEREIWILFLTCSLEVTSSLDDDVLLVGGNVKLVYENRSGQF